MVPQFNTGGAGSNGVAPTTADTASGDALGVVTVGPNSINVYSNDIAGLHFPEAFKLANNTATAEINTIGQLDGGGGAVSWFGSFTYVCTATPSGSLRLAQFRKNAAGIVGGIWQTTGNILQIRHGSDATAATLALAMTPGTAYRIEYQVVITGATPSTTGTIQVWLYAMDGKTPLDSSAATAVTITASISAIDLVKYGGGVTSSATWPAATGAQYFADLKAFYPSQATLISNVATVGSGLNLTSSILWGARVTKTLYNLSNYNIGSSNDAPWCSGDHTPTPFTLFSQHATKQPPAIHWGGSGTTLSAFDTTAEADTRTLGCFSNYSMAGSVLQLTDLLNNVNTNGGQTAFDALVNAIKTSGKPMLFRPLWEMNGNWGFNWQRANFTAAQYITLWRNIWQRCADIMGGFAAGSGSGTNTGNMAWFFCPNWVDGTSALAVDASNWFPGAQYVDVVGCDFYNKNDTNSPSFLGGTIIPTLRTLAPGKPIAIGETGCAAPTTYTGGKAQWITDFFAYVKANTDIKFFSWFNETGSPTNPYIEEGNASAAYNAEAQAAWASAIADPYFQAGGPAVVNDTNFTVGLKPPSLNGFASVSSGLPFTHLHIHPDQLHP